MHIVTNVGTVVIEETGRIQTPSRENPPHLINSVRAEVVWGVVVIDTYSDGETQIRAYKASDKFGDLCELHQDTDHSFILRKTRI